MVEQRVAAIVRELLAQARAMSGTVMRDFRILIGQVPVPPAAPEPTLCVAESRSKDI